MKVSLVGAALILGICAVACSSNNPAAAPVTVADGGAETGTGLTDAQYASNAVNAMHDTILVDLNTMHDALVDLQSAAPTTQGRGWDATTDAAAITTMKAAWVRARTAYEHIEGALAPLFPDIDTSIDARYDGFMAKLAAKGGDPYLFDDVGVTGMHAIERIVYLDTTPARVIGFEKVLPGYVAATYPATPTEASDFKTKLCARAIADAATLRDQWTPANIQRAVAFQGLISLMNEQGEKVNKAASNEEESRYSQRTMADIRDNLQGTITIYAAFKPWITSRVAAAKGGDDGASINAKTENGFASLRDAYANVASDAIPTPPATWSSQAPSASDLATPFGQLYTKVHSSIDAESGIVFQMNEAAKLLGFPAP